MPQLDLYIWSFNITSLVFFLIVFYSLFFKYIILRICRVIYMRYIYSVMVQKDSNIVISKLYSFNSILLMVRLFDLFNLMFSYISLSKKYILTVLMMKVQNSVYVTFFSINQLLDVQDFLLEINFDLLKFKFLSYVSNLVTLDNAFLIGDNLTVSND